MSSKFVMLEAWALARRGQTIYGGSVADFLPEALRITWAAYNANPVTIETRKIIAEIRAKKAALANGADQRARLSRGLRAAAARGTRRHVTKAYGSGYGATKYTAGW